MDDWENAGPQLICLFALELIQHLNPFSILEYDYDSELWAKSGALQIMNHLCV